MRLNITEEEYKCIEEKLLDMYQARSRFEDYRKILARKYNFMAESMQVYVGESCLEVNKESDLPDIYVYLNDEIN